VKEQKFNLHQIIHDACKKIMLKATLFFLHAQLSFGKFNFSDVISLMLDFSKIHYTKYIQREVAGCFAGKV
jgi:hypothetical protein